MSNWTFIQIEHNNNNLGQNDQWLQSTMTYNQIGQSKMTFLVNMDNSVLVKWDILYYLIS
jgi:hypothetical protein